MVPKGYYALEVYDSIDAYVEGIVYILQYYKIFQWIFICHTIVSMIGARSFWGFSFQKDVYAKQKLAHRLYHQWSEK